MLDSQVKLEYSNFNSNNLILIDCRYDYEFQGGHIHQAINIYDPDVIKTIFVDNMEKIKK